MKEKFVEYISGSWMPRIVEEDVKPKGKKDVYYCKGVRVTRNEKVIKEMQEKYGDIEYHALVY